MSIILRWYTDGQPDDKVPYPVLTADDGEPMEFPSVEDAIDYIGADLIDGNQFTGSGWRAVERE